MIVRSAVIADRDVIFHLLTELRRSGYTEMGLPFVSTPISENSNLMLSNLLNDKTCHILLVEDNQKIVGLCVAYEIPKILDGSRRILIEEMVVAPDQRNKGVGTKLLDRIELIAKDNNIMYVKVATGTKLKANDFYRNHGYVHFENSYRKKIF